MFVPSEGCTQALQPTTDTEHTLSGPQSYFHLRCFYFILFWMSLMMAQTREQRHRGFVVACHPCTGKAPLSLHNPCMIARFGTDYHKMFSCLSMRHYSILTMSDRIIYLTSMSCQKTYFSISKSLTSSLYALQFPLLSKSRATILIPMLGLAT